jgi:hypothetical protein
MVGLYETAVDELCSWTAAGKRVRPKVIASTATIRRAPDQVNKLFLRRLEVFPPHGTSIEDNFFSIQRAPSEKYPGRRYLGICAIGRRYPVATIRVYVALLAAAKRLYDQYDSIERLPTVKGPWAGWSAWECPMSLDDTLIKRWNRSAFVLRIHSVPSINPS